MDSMPYFSKKNWELVRLSFCATSMDILAGKSLPESLNDTCLVLLSKADHPNLASQFKPIELCNVLYKTVTKTIVNRLNPFFPKAISPTQGAFVPGRQITDIIVIVQEIFAFYEKETRKVWLYGH